MQTENTSLSNDFLAHSLRKIRPVNPSDLKEGNGLSTAWLHLLNNTLEPFKTTKSPFTVEYLISDFLDLF